jgi:hypothetical protein
MIKKLVIFFLCFLPALASADSCTELAASYANNPDALTPQVLSSK